MAKESHSKRQIFLKKLSQLTNNTDIEQKQIIKGMDEVISGMGEKEFKSVFTKELFNEIHEMIEEKKMTMENALMPLKNIGYWIELKDIFFYGFFKSLLYERFMETFEEEQKKEEENEKLLADLCECFLLLNSVASSKLLPIWVRRLLKVALNKEESEETQNEVELALLALSIMAPENEFEKELYLNDITEIIKHHQEHHNLTHLGYQSAWGFLITRFHRGYGLEPTVVDKLHFAREATKELEELMRRLNWKKNERELEKSVEFNTIKRWMKSISVYTGDIFCVRNEEEHIGLTACVAKLYDAAKCNKNSIYGKCTWFFLLMSNSDMWIQEKTDVFAKSGAVERVLDCVCWETFEDNDSVGNCFYVFTSLCDRLESAEYRELDYAKWKIKRKIFEKLEEGGYEDIVTSFIEVLPTDDIFYNFSHDIKDYLLFI